MNSTTSPHSQLSAKDIAIQVQEAFDKKQPLAICGGGSKGFYGHAVKGTPLLLSDYQGIINYEPSELVITAKAGTPLHIIEAALDEQNQMLGFEPPHFGREATLGGTIACGLSGPRRPYSGAARDFVLGVTMINGKGEILRFGGQVMKNVAGYDVSRLMCGAQGTLGVLLDISLKVIPKPAFEHTLLLQQNEQQMQLLLSKLGRQPLPISATCLYDDSLYIRLSGTEPGVKAAMQKIGGEVYKTPSSLWHTLKEQQHALFSAGAYLRLSLPPAAPSIPEHLITDQLIEWGGAQRWVLPRNNDVLCGIENWAAEHGGYTTLFNRSTQAIQFRPLDNLLGQLNEKVRHSFDPARILNPGRLYPDS